MWYNEFTLLSIKRNLLISINMFKKLTWSVISVTQRGTGVQFPKWFRTKGSHLILLKTCTQ